MKHIINKLSTAAFAGLCVFVFFGCPTNYPDLPLLGGGLIEIETGEIFNKDGTPRGWGGRGASGGRCADNINSVDSDQGYVVLKLPEDIEAKEYTVKFRYATGEESFAVKFTVNNGDAIFTNKTEAGNGWDFAASHDLLATTEKVPLKGGDELKIQTSGYGAIDYLYLEP
ncbi:MAG: hypothetical protein LBL20_08285 [Treponema sp.]|jgi:hypothetical protein|nr:hypothetical protein [Treponema sp.]